MGPTVGKTTTFGLPRVFTAPISWAGTIGVTSSGTLAFTATGTNLLLNGATLLAADNAIVSGRLVIAGSGGKAVLSGIQIVGGLQIGSTSSGSTVDLDTDATITGSGYLWIENGVTIGEPGNILGTGAVILSSSSQMNLIECEVSNISM